ncbi:MAG: MutT-like protein [Candidatus Uhrbacteria bacterium GW2011_GWF2_44_350]|uniref:MutT-like protein n=1 Tax=Candidatus Uhrbacteria bacterium GW2011_GWF2_44_350 TaxID=1619000 RepID=A0A0G1JE18_9BACT|nr:MAG: MutT-like protein [Candidatus Uhrbacteria bacterium GW2011_GWF2_44_350]
METIRCRNNRGDFSEIPKEKFFFRPSVYGLIQDGDKIVLLKNKSSGKLWFPGGGIEIGEKIEEALIREVQEETGLEIQIEKLLLFRENFFYYEPEDGAYHAFLFFYFCTIKPGSKLIADDLVDDLEASEPRWIKISDLKEENFHDIKEDCMNMIRSLTKEND